MRFEVLGQGLDSRPQLRFLLTLAEVGEPDREEALVRQVVERRSTTLGATHPDARTF